ncbi:CgeB family protein [Sphingomicrobium arenosum]|uniref:hypothetical protein n=1 Tax=Sphingomicrobium arenosum TaxID=2233861 RepID=UPI0022400F11|nr:hypothetical protein [Sphingomicrobium arenosum]
MQVAITLSPVSYLPEAHAYRQFLSDRGMSARLVESANEIKPEDVAILFTARDFLRRDLTCHRRIHEYHSLSGGRARLAKDWAKWHLAAPAHGHAFLEGPPHQCYARLIPAALPTYSRPMGIDRDLFDRARGSAARDHDLVYCGSLNRPGVAATFERLGKAGFSILAIGHVPPSWPRPMLERLGVHFTGPRPRDELPGLLATARAGLNITPDTPPFSLQESTKTLEYVAAGLPLVSNRYRWVEDFASTRGLAVQWLDQLHRPADLDSLEPPQVDLRARAWPDLLAATGFDRFIEAVAA